MNLRNFFERYLEEELTPSQKDEVDKWPKGDNSFSDHAFTGEDEHRSMIPLQHPSELSPHHVDVKRHLEQHGINIEDYAGNKATDKHGRAIKIGKALVKTGAPDDLIKRFNEDSARSRSKSGVDDYRVNISRHPHDVAGMSSRGHTWENESCMNFSTGMHRDYLPADVRHGTHVAYLTHKDDKTNKEPVGRIALKRYTNIEDESDHILRPENRTYGNAPDAFSHTVNKWANKHFPGREDAIYKKSDHVYDDTGNSIIIGKKALPRAIESGSSELHAHAARHPDLTPEHIDQFIKADHIHPRQVARALENPNASPQNIENALNHSNTGVVIQALRSPHITEEHLRKVAKRHDGPGADPMVLGEIMKHPKATSDIHDIGMRSKKWVVRSAVMQHPNVSAKHLTQGLNDEHENVQTEAIANSNANAGHITQALLPHMPDLVREFAAGHPNATPEHINMALDDPNHRVRAYAASHPKASHENIMKGLDHSQPSSVRSRSLHNLNATSDHVFKALDDPDKHIAYDAINHREASTRHIEKAINHPSLMIKYAAIDHPHATPDHIRAAMATTDNQQFHDHANEMIKKKSKRSYTGW